MPNRPSLVVVVVVVLVVVVVAAAVKRHERLRRAGVHGRCLAYGGCTPESRC